MTDQNPELTTVCPRCSVGCHLARNAEHSGAQEQENSRARGREGSRARGRDGPANPNGRLCQRGVRTFDVFDGEDRLDRPLIRQNGDLVAVSWETAYNRVATEFETILDDCGPSGLAFFGAPHCTNEENYLLGKLARLLGTNDVDNHARLCHAASSRVLRERLGWPATTNGLEELAEADVFLVVGANPAARQPVAFNAFVRPALNDGATLVHIDPVGNQTTRMADIHLAPRPDTDALLFDLLSSKLVETTGGNRAFVANRTRNFEAFARAVNDFDYETGVATVGITRTTVDDVAALIADADRVAALVGTGIESTPDDTDAADSLLNLMLLTGNLGRRGTGIYLLRGFVNEQGAIDAGCVPDRLPGHQPVTDPEARARFAAEWGNAPPSEPGETAHELLSSFGDRIKGALVVGENPAISKRDPDWLHSQLDTLDSLVVVEVSPSETTSHADVVLPAAASVETEGTVTNVDRRVQRLHPTAPPPGEARADWRILCELGKRLHTSAEQFDYDTPEAVFNELSRVAPTHAGRSYSSLEPDGCRWPFDGQDVLYSTDFETPDGRAPFAPPEPVADSVDEQGLRLVTGGRTSDIRGSDSVAERPLRIHPDDADERGIEERDRVTVSTGETAIIVVAQCDSSVRQGTVYLHAAVADPLLRDDTSTVTLTA